jgi:N-hydroxyarylamine O-acetyltransferase
MNVKLYLKRINYKNKIDTSLNTLFELQKKHIKNVPFENLGIHYNKEIKLDVDAIYRKIVRNKRGGFCYELNGLFYNLLKTIGFDVKMISAKVHKKDGIYGKEFDHLATIARVDNQDYLVDVGFGKFAFEPLALKMNVLLNDDFGKFQFDKFKEGYFRINELVEGKLIPQYIFKTIPRKLSDFETMCTFHQTSSQSHFTTKKVITIFNGKERITLNDNLLKITTNGKVSELHFKESKKFDELLKKYFDIEIA